MSKEINDWNSFSEAEFRAHIRKFIEENCPQSLRNRRDRLPPQDTMGWYKALHKAGMIAPGWPKRYGGMELSAARHLVFIEEMEAAGTPWLHDSGVRNLGPAIIAHGTEEQKEHYLPKIAAGEQIWCQGYSEPNSGSDLASLRCAGVVQDNDIVVNGQKIWTTSAQHASHIFMLVRTDNFGAKQAGITFLLADMSSPGITVRPIRNLYGEEDFCEVFFDDVRVPLANVLGEINQGWRVARSLLGFERIWAGSPKRAMKALRELSEQVEEQQLVADQFWQHRLTQSEFDTLDAQDLYKTFADMISNDGTLGAEVSALKIFSTEVFQKITEYTMEACGNGSCIVNTPMDSHSPVATYFESRAPTIFAGTSEVHRNILAKKILNLGLED